MISKRVKFSFLVSFFFLIFLFFPQGFTQAFCPCPCSCICYNAESTACYPMIFIGNCLEGCCPCGCGATPCGGQRPCEKCGDWQVASRCEPPECQPAVEKTDKGPKPQPCCVATNWSPQKPECLACSECIEEPTNPRYYKNPLCPLDPWNPDEKACQEARQEPNNVYLGVKLDWEDVEGWIEGWRLPNKRVVKKNNGERCEMVYEAGEDLVRCMKNCKNECWEKMEKEWKGPEKNPASKWNIGQPSTAKERAEKEVEKEIEYRDYLPKCFRKCEKKCIDTHKTNAGGICPFTGTVFHCDPPAEYIKSYIIEIKGDLRNTGALKKIAILEREMELLEARFFYAQSPLLGSPTETLKRIEEIKAEIEKITYNELQIKKYGAALHKSEFIPTLTPAPGTGFLEDGRKIPVPNHSTSGFFQSHRTYQWRVRACINEYQSYEEYERARGESCGPWNPWWEFKTNPVPEPGLPYDPDWNGKRKDYPTGWDISGMAKELPKWAVRFLRWPEIDDEKETHYTCKKWYQPRGGEKEGYVLTGGLIFKKLRDYCSPWSFLSLLHYKYREEEEGKCHPAQKKEEGKCRPMTIHRSPDWPGTGTFVARSEFPNEYYDYFTKLTYYDWQLKACIDDGATECTDFSQKWQFSVEDFTLKKPELISPPNTLKPETGLPVIIEWVTPEGALSYRYEIFERDKRIVEEKTTSSGTQGDYPRFELDTPYSWKVKPCWDYDANRCEDFWSDTFYFKTTGRPPKAETMKPEGVINIPTTFSWEAVPGAKSYRFHLAPTGTSFPVPGLPFTTLPRIAEMVITTVKEPEITINYPDLLLDKDYHWMVETCAHEAGEACGQRSEKKMVRTIAFLPPAALKPDEGENLVAGEKEKYYLSWTPVPGANFYQYKVSYVEKSPEEKEEKCQPGLLYQRETKITQSDALVITCLGKYQWQVRACLGGFCPKIMPLPIFVLSQECCESPHLGSDWQEFTFNLVPAPPPAKEEIGLVPCGRRTENPNTPWKETDPCQIKHLFILLWNILDFLLWRIAPILLVLLTLATGGIYYLSMGMPATIIDIKSLWKRAGIGYGIIFFAWLIVDLLLLIFGYQVGVFGPWWQINL